MSGYLRLGRSELLKNGDWKKNVRFYLGKSENCLIFKYGRSDSWDHREELGHARPLVWGLLLEIHSFLLSPLRISPFRWVHWMRLHFAQITVTTFHYGYISLWLHFTVTTFQCDYLDSVGSIRVGIMHRWISSSWWQNVMSGSEYIKVTI